MINIPYLSPFKSFCVHIGNLPSAYTESMSYYEMLEWLCNYLENTVIPAVNTNADAVTELQGLYTQLKNYVDNYFENLDVQEEINNKLDEMVEEGTLQELIAAYIQLKSILSYDTVASMKSALNIVEGSFIETYGFYSKGDGGSAKYKARLVTNLDNVNESTLIALHDTTLVAELIIDESMNVKQFGVKADGTTDNTNIMNIILGLNKKTLYFPDGTYLINSKLTINNCKKIHGESESGTIIKAPNGFVEWNSNNEFREISKLTIDGVTINSNTAIKGILSFSKLTDLIIKNYTNGINTLQNSWIDNFNNIFINLCTNGFVHTGDNFNNIVFSSCYFQHITNYCTDIKGFNVKFVGCNFESSNYCFHNSCRMLEIDNCYIEGNEIIFNFNSAFFDTSTNMHDSWLLPKTNPSSGWLATIYTVSSPDTVTAPFELTNNYIDNRTVDTIKPFSFTSNSNKTYIGVSLFRNYYKNIKSSDQYVIYYDDLFDTTNCPGYGTTSNPTTFSTDLALYKYDNIVWLKEDFGNYKGYSSKNRKIKMIGYYSVSSTGHSQITISPSKRYGNMYPQINNIPVIVRYTDGVLENKSMSIDAGNFYISVDSTKTTERIIFNNEYYQGL